MDPSVIVVKGGVHETYCSEYTLTHVPEIDYCLRGEADLTFPAFLEAVPDLEELGRVPGLTWRVDEHIVVNRPSAEPIHLDALPYPARDLLDASDYYDFAIFEGRRTTQVQTMRGCPFACHFCNQRRRNPSLRATESVVEELEAPPWLGLRRCLLRRPYVHRQLCPHRGVGGGDRERRSGHGVRVPTRSELVNGRLLQHMADVGFGYVSFGLETTNEQSLLAFGKTRSQTRHLQAAQDAVSSCRSAGIRSCLNLIVGFPGETDESVIDTLSTAAALDPDFASVSALALYPHEDATTADQYHEGVSEEPVWRSFDEGYGAIHPYLSSSRAEELVGLATSILGQRLDVVAGPASGPRPNGSPHQ